MKCWMVSEVNFSSQIVEIYKVNNTPDEMLKQKIIFPPHICLKFRGFKILRINSSVGFFYFFIFFYCGQFLWGVMYH